MKLVTMVCLLSAFTAQGNEEDSSLIQVRNQNSAGSKGRRSKTPEEEEEEEEEDYGGEDPCIGGWQAGDSWSRDTPTSQVSTQEECVETVKTNCPDANGATFFKGKCFCEYDSCGVAHADGGWETANHCLFREISVPTLDANGCAGGWVAGIASHYAGQPMIGTASSQEECLAMVREQKGDVANGASFLKSQSKCWASINSSTYVMTDGGYESATTCFFGYWCGWGDAQQGATQATTTTTTVAAACAGQIVCGDLPDSIGDAWSTTYKYSMGPKRKFGPDGTWATPYCKDVRGCEEVYCPNGCAGAAMWEKPPYINSLIDYNPALKKYAHYLYCSQTMEGINMGGADKPGTKVNMLRSGWTDCRNSDNATKKPYWSETDNVDLVKQMMQSKPNGRGGYWPSQTERGGTKGSGTMNMGHEFCPEGIVNDCCAFKWGNLNHCGATGQGTGWSGYNGGKTNEGGPNTRCSLGEVFNDNGYYSEVWCGEPQAKNCKCVTTCSSDSDCPSGKCSNGHCEADDDAGGKDDGGKGGTGGPNAQCVDKCYTKKGNLNPARQCPKDQCKSCCECTGECPPDLTPLEPPEKEEEVTCEEKPEYKCAKWCYSKKHSPKPWAEQKCNWFACSTCPECEETEEPECDKKKCYNQNNGKFKKQFCEDIKCAACPECGQEEEPTTPQCDEKKCYNQNNGKFKQQFCTDMKCAACPECGQEAADKPLKCDDSCFSPKTGGLKNGICSKTKCAGCSGC